MTNRIPPDEKRSQIWGFILPAGAVRRPRISAETLCQESPRYFLYFGPGTRMRAVSRFLTFPSTQAASSFPLSQDRHRPSSGQFTEDLSRGCSSFFDLRPVLGWLPFSWIGAPFLASQAPPKDSRILARIGVDAYFPGGLTLPQLRPPSSCLMAT